MFALLSWLWDRASRVYEFFDTLYWSIRNAALYAYGWARQAVTDAINAAVRWASPLIDAVRALAYSLYSLAVNLTWYVYNLAIAWASNAVETAKTYLRGLIDFWVGLLRGLIDIARAEAWALVEGLKPWVTGLVNALSSTLNLAFGWITPYRDLLKGLAEVFTAENLARLVRLFQEDYTKLIVFISNPLGSIFAYIEPRFLEFLSYVIGYAMGAVKVTLPPPPSWGGAGGVIPPPGEPGPVGGILAWPLDHLSVSGYRFNNPAGHMGVDFGLAMGQSVYACHDGAIEIARDVGNGYALCVTVRGDPWWSRYAHLEGFYVLEGQKVRARDPIAAGNTTGNSTGPHLHLEVKRNGVFVDPLTVL